jgi:hypothetical protein
LQGTFPMSHPLVSVVIPTYNCGQFIAETLESLFSQSYPNIEVIVIDDGSSDGTFEALNPYMGRIVYRQQSNAGLGAARNAGMRLARGEYLAWCDADDICASDRLLVQVAYLAQNPAAVAVGTNFSAFEGDGRVFDPAHAVTYYSELALHGLAGVFQNSEDFDGRDVGWVAQPLSQPCKVYWGDAWQGLLLGNFMHPPTMMIRSHVRERAGWLQEDLRKHEDWEYLTRIARFGAMAFIDAPLLKYRCHSAQMSSEATPEGPLNCIRVLESHLRLCGHASADVLRKFDSRLADSHADAAYALARLDKMSALRHLSTAVLLNRLRLRRRYASHLARILVPADVLRMIRGLRGSRVDGKRRRHVSPQGMASFTSNGQASSSILPSPLSRSVPGIRAGWEK